MLELAKLNETENKPTNVEINKVKSEAKNTNLCIGGNKICLEQK